MAYPQGRLLAVRNSTGYILTPDDWSRLSAALPVDAEALTREDAEDWCARQGWDLELLDAVPLGAA